MKKICSFLLAALILSSGFVTAYASANDIPETSAVSYVQATGNLYVRSGPGKNYKILGILKKGRKVETTGTANNGWYRIRYNGKNAYASNKYLRRIGSSSKTTTASNQNVILYSTTSLNVRKGPGTSYAKLCVLKRGQAVTKLGTAKNGWYKIKVNGKTGYASNKYLTTKKPVASKLPKSSASSKKSFNRFISSSLGINVAVYECSASDGKTNQRIVDAKDSAAYMEFGSQYLLADHNYQGFSRIANAIPGKTTATLHGKTYVCTKVGKGRNIRSDLLDENGKSLSSQNSGGLCLYTCQSGSTEKIHYTLWRIK